MIVTCYSCSTSFNLDDSLVKPGGTKVRCSRCKHFFILYPPDAIREGQTKSRFDAAPTVGIKTQPVDGPPDLELDESDFSHLDLAGLEFEDDNSDLYDLAQGDDPTGEGTPRYGDGLELSGGTGPELDLELDSLEIELETDNENDGFDIQVFHSDDVDADDPSDFISFDEDDSEFELELNTDQSPQVSEPPPIPFQEIEKDAHPDDGVQYQAPLKSGGPDFDKPDSEDLISDSDTIPESTVNFKKLVLVLIPCLLIAVILSALVASKMTGFKIPYLSELKLFGNQTAVEGPAPPVPSQNDVNGRFVTNANAGKLYVLTGTVDNPSKATYSHIQVKASLFAKDQAEPITGFAFCGNIIPDPMLAKGNIKDINAALSVKKGSQVPNVGIKPGASIPYMVVFTNITDKHESVTVQVSSYETQ